MQEATAKVQDEKNSCKRDEKAARKNNDVEQVLHGGNFKITRATLLELDVEMEKGLKKDTKMASELTMDNFHSPTSYN